MQISKKFYFYTFIYLFFMISISLMVILSNASTYADEPFNHGGTPFFVMLFLMLLHFILFEIKILKIENYKRFIKNTSIAFGLGTVFGLLSWSTLLIYSGTNKALSITMLTIAILFISALFATLNIFIDYREDKNRLGTSKYSQLAFSLFWKLYFSNWNFFYNINFKEDIDFENQHNFLMTTKKIYLVKYITEDNPVLDFTDKKRESNIYDEMVNKKQRLIKYLKDIDSYNDKELITVFVWENNEQSPRIYGNNPENILILKLEDFSKTITRQEKEIEDDLDNRNYLIKCIEQDRI